MSDEDDVTRCPGDAHSVTMTCGGEFIRLVIETTIPSEVVVTVPEIDEDLAVFVYAEPISTVPDNYDGIWPMRPLLTYLLDVMSVLVSYGLIPEDHQEFVSSMYYTPSRDIFKIDTQYAYGFVPTCRFIPMQSRSRLEILAFISDMFTVHFPDVGGDDPLIDALDMVMNRIEVPIPSCMRHLSSQPKINITYRFPIRENLTTIPFLEAFLLDADVTTDAKCLTCMIARACTDLSMRTALRIASDILYHEKPMHDDDSESMTLDDVMDHTNRSNWSVLDRHAGFRYITTVLIWIDPMGTESTDSKFTHLLLT